MTDVSSSVMGLVETRIVMFAIALVIGSGIGVMIRADPVTVPGVGTISSVILGAVVTTVGIGLYLARDRYTAADCGCGDDCGC